jgi:hypothetical protein
MSLLFAFVNVAHPAARERRIKTLRCRMAALWKRRFCALEGRRALFDRKP